MRKRHLILPEIFQRLTWGPLRFLMIVFCSIEINGTKHIKNLNGNMIIASSHQSELDPLLIVSCLPFFCRQFPIIYVTREKNFYEGQNWKKWKQIFYGGTFFRMIGGYQTFIGLKNYKLALRHHVETLSLGHNVGIFPTGKRISGKKLTQAKGGVSFLAQESNAPIIPVLIQGLEYLTLKRLFSKKMKVTVSFGNPLYIKDLIKNPNQMIINSKQNDYEKAATEVLKQIEKLA